MAKKTDNSEPKENFLTVAKELAKERGLDEEVLLQAIEDGIVAGFRREFSSAKGINDVGAEIDRETGEIFVYKLVEVVEEVLDPDNEISLEEAKGMDDEVELGDSLEVGLDVDKLGRLAATAAKSAISQKVRDAEYNRIYSDFSDKIGEIATGIVQRKDSRYVYVDIARAEAVLPKDQQIKNEIYDHNTSMKFLVQCVEEHNGRPSIRVSRTSPELVKKLFELEIPEIAAGEVVIMAVSREPGSRSKVAVRSRGENIDAKGACVGQRGQRVQQIMQELGGEKIDIVDYSENIAEFISAALQPAKVDSVDVETFTRDDGRIENRAQVVVEDDQYSLAIGKSGQNVRLAARLTGCKIDIKTRSTVSQVESENFINEFTVVEAEEEN